MNTNIFRGPDGWTLVADRREVYPEDPGQGTPLMVYGPRAASSGTLGRVLDTAEVDGPGCRLDEVPSRVMRWLERVADEAQAWVFGEE